MRVTPGEVMMDLRRQREVLQHSKSNLSEMDDWIESSKKIISRMAQRTLFMSALWWLIVLLLLAVIALIVYLKFVRK